MFSDFHGVIATGWQRYDHFASLCELWPVSMPSLGLSLRVLERFIISGRVPCLLITSPRFIESDAEDLLKALKCPDGTDLNQVIGGSDNCRFPGLTQWITQLTCPPLPGYKVRNAIRAYIQLKSFHENSTWVHTREAGWLQASQMTLGTSSAYIVDKVKSVYLNAITKLEKTIIPNLKWVPPCLIGKTSNCFQVFSQRNLFRRRWRRIPHRLCVSLSRWSQT